MAPGLRLHEFSKHGLSLACHRALPSTASAPKLLFAIENRLLKSLTPHGPAAGNFLCSRSLALRRDCHRRRRVSRAWPSNRRWSVARGRLSPVLLAACGRPCSRRLPTPIARGRELGETRVRQAASMLGLYRSNRTIGHLETRVDSRNRSRRRQSALISLNEKECADCRRRLQIYWFLNPPSLRHK